MNDLPNLSRTATALAAYDEMHARIVPMETNAEAMAYFEELDRLAEAVGKAYGLDTSDRNDYETCLQYVRPGPFVRRMVAEWERQNSN
jgi:hypothetical protein